MELIPSEQGRDEAIQIVLKAAAESITLEHIKKISSYREEKKKQEKERGYVKFTKKEIETMPDNLKRLFVVDEKIVSYRCINGMYQARPPICRSYRVKCRDAKAWLCGKRISSI